jgi:hypothetical protein
VEITKLARISGRLEIMTKIRPEQMSHRKFLRRGRSTRRLQVALLVLAIIAAGVGAWASLTITA